MGASINYVIRWGWRGRGLAKCLCCNINLCGKLAYGGGGGVKNLQNLAYVVYGCPFLWIESNGKHVRFSWYVDFIKLWNYQLTGTVENVFWNINSEIFLIINFLFTTNSLKSALWLTYFFSIFHIVHKWKSAFGILKE